MDNSCSGIKKLVNDFKRYSPLLNNLVSRDIKVKYRRSVLGVAWSILNPLLTMVVLTAVFQHLLRLPAGSDYPTYYIVGASLWTFFAESTNLSLTSVLGSASLIKKVYIPKYMFPLEKCLFALVNFLFSLIAVLLVMFVRGVYPTWTSLLFFVPVIYCFIFACGLSLLLSALTVYFRDIIHLYSVLLTLWMYLTPILYSMEMLKDQPTINTIVHLNPLYYYVTYFRDVVMFNTVPGLQFNLICIVVSLVTFIAGWFVFRKTEGRFILHI